MAPSQRQPCSNAAASYAASMGRPRPLELAVVACLLVVGVVGWQSGWVSGWLDDDDCVHLCCARPITIHENGIDDAYEVRIAEYGASYSDAKDVTYTAYRVRERPSGAPVGVGVWVMDSGGAIGAVDAFARKMSAKDAPRRYSSDAAVNKARDCLD